ncbi:MAG: isopentenyl-diphosphate delta-isomerase, partial [Calditrichaeota bacterium]|nr:isopentenyl-diphosphate delta-isomerase [Calditrichota bacterium]
HLFTFEYQARYGDVGSEHEMCSVLIGHSDQEPDPNPTEIAAWRYIGIEALSEEIEAHPALYSPWLKLEWARLMADHRKDIDAL